MKQNIKHSQKMKLNSGLVIKKTKKDKLKKMINNNKNKIQLNKLINKN